jgi:hypothetical protein
MIVTLQKMSSANLLTFGFWLGRIVFSTAVIASFEQKY